MKTLHHNHWLFVTICVIGIVSLFLMGGVNLYIDNHYVGIGEIGIAVVGLFNLGWYLYKRNLTLASHVVLISIMILFGIIMIDGGVRETGWMWIFLFPTLAFAIRNVVTASWYVSVFGVYLAIITTLEIWGIDVSVYSRIGLVQMCAAYAVISLMLSFTERMHERVEHDYLTISHELEHERSELWRQRDQLRIFKTAVEQSSEMMILTDPEGIVLWANAATERVTGFGVKETVGKKAGVLWGKLMDEDYYRNLWHKIKEKKELFVSEIQNHRKSGEHFFSTINIYPLLDKSGVVQYFVATQRDITEQKEVDQMKTDFVSLVSHQLRTPLTAIRWNLEMLLGGDIGRISKAQKEIVSQVLSSNERMIKLISTLLNISRIESGKLTVEVVEVELNHLLGGLEAECNANEKGQKLELILLDEELVARVDVEILRNIVSNFVSNASKYSPPDSTIRVKLSRKGDNYEISVSDQGYGIPAAEQRKIFGKFFRASNVRKYDADGTGMGLYISSLLAKLLGGKIEFESKVGQGSTFSVMLPIRGVSTHPGKVRLI